MCTSKKEREGEGVSECMRACSVCPVQPSVAEHMITMADTLATGMKPKLLSIKEMQDILSEVNAT